MAKLSFYKESGAVTQAPTNGVHNAFVYKKDASGNVVGWLSDTGGTYHPITISKLDWSVTNMVNQPTTLSGYGITDAYTINEVDNITGDLGNLNTNNTNNLVAAINELNSAVADGMKPPNPIDCSSNPPYPAANAGETWKVTVGGKVGGANGEIVTPGDLIIAMNDSPGGSQATAGGDFFIVNTNIDSATEAVEGTGRIATTQEVATGNNDFAWVTPLKLDGVLDSYYTKSYLQGKDFWSITTADINNWNAKAELTDINDSTIKFKINGVVVTDDFTLNQGTNETIDLGTPYTDEEAQDSVGTILDSTLTYSDGTPSIGVNTSVIASKSWANSQFLTTETDPTVPSHVKNITTGDISDWNAKAELSDIKDGQFTVSGTGSLTGSGSMTANQSGNTTAQLDLTASAKQDIIDAGKQDLQSVTDNGNETTDGVIINDTTNDPLAVFNKKYTYVEGGFYNRILKYDGIDPVGDKSRTLSLGMLGTAGNIPAFYLGISEAYPITKKSIVFYEGKVYYSLNIDTSLRPNSNEEIATLADIPTSLYTDEEAQDAVGNILSSDFIYNDANPGISIDTTKIATRSWANSQFLTTETDPVFNASPAGGITSGDISNWNNKAELSDINNSTITINTGTGLDGGSTFTLNQSSNKTINLKAVWAATPEW